MSKQLMKGNDALMKSAILSGCRAFYGYPITPASEITETAALYMPQAGGVFLQAESEVAAINMLYGASSAGVRCMTSSSGPGISLMQEGISYMAGAELPCVIADIMRGGPGLGNIAPEQGDYNQIVKGGGHGCYRTLVLAPASVQEMADFTTLAFDLADRYGNPWWFWPTAISVIIFAGINQAIFFMISSTLAALGNELSHAAARRSYADVERVAARRRGRG